MTQSSGTSSMRLRPALAVRRGCLGETATSKKRLSAKDAQGTQRSNVVHRCGPHVLNGAFPVLLVVSG